MDKPWNPQEPSSAPDSEPARPSESNPDSGNGIKQSPIYTPHEAPQTPATPPGQQPPPSQPQNPWAAPSGEGATWARPQQPPRTTETPAYRPPAAGGSGGGWGQAPPPNNFSFSTDPINAGSTSKGTSNGSKIGLAIMVVLLMIGSGAIGGRVAGGNKSSSSGTTRTVAPVVSNTSDPASQPLAKVASAVQPSVVSIEITSRGTPVDTGSGIVYASDGTIVTNNHVIAAAVTAQSPQIQVKFSDGHTTNATIVGRDPSTDIAVIKVTNTGLTQAALGSASSLHVGDSVLALGSPLGLDGSVASGIVSALHRSVNLGSENQDQTNPFGGQTTAPSTASAVTDAIQTDAAINPGNSGGPLVDINGKVVGINTAIASLGSSGSSQSGSIGVGFAIPIEEVQSVADQLIQGKTPQHAILGVQISDDPNGALIQNITSGGAADKAGLKEGDIITKFGSKSVGGADELSAAVRGNRPGDKVTITYTRSGATKTTDVTLGSSND